VTDKETADRALAAVAKAAQVITTQDDEIVALKTRLKELELSLSDAKAQEKHLAARCIKLDQEVTAKLRQIAELRTVNDELRASLMMEQLFGHLRHAPPRRTGDLSLPDGMTIKDLVKLVHPDRHNNSELATKFTAHFLSLMRRSG